MCNYMTESLNNNHVFITTVQLLWGSLGIEAGDAAKIERSREFLGGLTTSPDPLSSLRDYYKEVRGDEYTKFYAFLGIVLFTIRDEVPTESPTDDYRDRVLYARGQIEKLRSNND